MDTQFVSSIKKKFNTVTQSLVTKTVWPFTRPGVEVKLVLFFLTQLSSERELSEKSCHKKVEWFYFSILTTKHNTASMNDFQQKIIRNNVTFKYSYTTSLELQSLFTPRSEIKESKDCSKVMILTFDLFFSLRFFTCTCYFSKRLSK